MELSQASTPFQTCREVPPASFKDPQQLHLYSSMARKKMQETTLVPHRTPNLSTLLDRAKSGNEAVAVKAYLDAGGSPGTQVFGRGQMALLYMPLLHHIALYNAHPHKDQAEGVRLLIEAGADINAKAGPRSDDRTALMDAVERTCCTKVLQVFLQDGADVSVPSSGGGMTVLHLAADAGYSAACELLMARDSNLLELEDDSGWTAVMHAVAFASIDTVMMLCKHGADMSTVDSPRKRTPLIVACVHDRPDMAAYLIEAGVDVNAVDCDGTSALMQAALADSAQLVQLLFSNGANSSATNTMGRNAVFAAVHNGHVHMMQTLVQHGVCITAVDSEGYTVLMKAAARGAQASC
eukprot:8158-Heterococcus_DN1.PRE.1